MSLVTLKSVKKKFGPEDLFSNFSLTINDDERLGIIGPNGAGKSTLLKILAGEEDIDAGDIFRKNGLKTVYVEQLATFAEGVSPNDLLRAVTARFGGTASLQFQQGSKVMAEFGVENLEADASRFSGGQKKLLQLALAFSEEPDLLLLDEPTNHLDSDRVQFLEGLLRRASFPWVVISHDRAFLENTVRRVAEVNRIYPDGVFSSIGGYRKFKVAREDFLDAEQRRIESLENVVRVEKAWLARGPKARGTKARARSERAEGMIQNLSELKDRQKQSSADISFASSQRKTKELAELVEVSKSYDDKQVLDNVSFKLVSRARIGVLGANGSGKSTLLKIIGGFEDPSSGKVKRANGLSVTYFEQIDRDDNQGKSLKEYLAPDGDSVVFRGAVHHVASWAKRFRFGFEQLSQPLSSLSGGEKARARIARLVLQESDVLLLDEPGNDLDIDTLESLE
ncbi:MAG: ABC-F family ATP-binding cassette domain-containing protein, partial [bacterium]|nr:ABC-F family ATP-binding cassette domain-containing protein [bacterium]